MTKPKVGIDLKDGLADVYAFATLYDFLVENEFAADIKIREVNDAHLIESFLQTIKNKVNYDDMFEYPSNSDLCLISYCDLACTLRDKGVAIDLSVLKNCVEPISRERREELKLQYEIPGDKPVLVVGCPDNDYHGGISLRRNIQKLCKDACIYVVGNTKEDGLIDGLDEKIKVIDAKGVLKDYYAIADVAMINANISNGIQAHHLHNFVEATAGGPLFLVKPDNTAQYGYKQLVEREVIREAENTTDLIDKVKRYMQNPDGDRVREQRRMHLEYSRNLYLADLMRLFNKLLRISDDVIESDLEFYSTHLENFNSMKIIHPETDWGSSSDPHKSSKEWYPLKEFDVKLWRGR